MSCWKTGNSKRKDEQKAPAASEKLRFLVAGVLFAIIKKEQEYAILYSAFCNGKLDEMPERFEDWDACYDVKKPWVEDL